jgi:hypothetical protein
MPIGHVSPAGGITGAIATCTKTAFTQPPTRSLEALSLQHRLELEPLAPFDGLQPTLIAQVQRLDPFPVDGLIASELEPGATVVTTLGHGPILRNTTHRCDRKAKQHDGKQRHPATRMTHQQGAPFSIIVPTAPKRRRHGDQHASPD